jgi:hypothetical protein
MEQRIQQIEVPCLTFDALLEKHRVQRVDFLNIDAEQNDFEILSMIDFTRWRPNIICVETSEFTDEQEMRANQLLRLAGYQYPSRSHLPRSSCGASMSASADARLRAAPTLVVTLKDGELSIPVPGGYPIVVGLPQLLLIEALADATPRPVATAVRAVAQRTGVSEADLAASWCD